MSRKPYIGPSDAQANAEALAMRGRHYAPEHHASVTTAWDFRKREPSDLREAVRMVRRAYADEVPTKLHEGYDSIGEGGTPRMTARAEGYIFGDPRSDDAGRNPETGERDAVGYYHSPFRAALAQLEAGSDPQRRRARILRRITIGNQGPEEAAIAELAHPDDAKWVAERTIRAFLRTLSDMRIRVPRHDEVTVSDTVTAA